MVTEAATPEPEVATLATDEVTKAAGGAEPAEAGNVATMAEASEPAHSAPETAAPTVATVPTIEPGVSTERDAPSIAAEASTFTEAAGPYAEVVAVAKDEVVNSAEGTEPAQAGTVPTMVVAPEGAQAAPDTAVPAVGTVHDIEPSDVTEPEALAMAADLSMVAEAAMPEPEVATLATDEVTKSAGGAEPTQACTVPSSTKAFEPMEAAPETGAPPVATVPTIVVAPEGAQAAPETAVRAVGTVPDIEPSDA